MLKSMTGYGRGQINGQGRSFLVEVRSVNNRYLDCNIRMPRVYACAEDGIIKQVKNTISRGKVDVFVTIENTAEEPVTVTLNEGVAAGYKKALDTMAEKFNLKEDISVSLLSRFPDVFKVEKVPEDLESMTAELHQAAALALADFDAMRSREGEKLAEDLLSRLDTLEEFDRIVEERSPQRVAAYREKLTARIQEVLEDRQLDESRILTEAAIFADKVAVDEETVRLRSHIAQFRDMIAGGSPIGRKLDFLVQEMNRETNTIGSKANDLEMSSVVVDMKAELEKIREQIQNVE
ncbi:MAG: YicC family protein [Oscillospiraceae bacterium]|nr:YicC family protein [Oscillospiraceae bacterium]